MTKSFKLAAVALMAAVLAQSAVAETWRMATKMPVDSPEGKVFQAIADKTAEYSNGTLEIQVFPNEQLGKEDAVLEQLQSNVVQIYAEGFGFLKKWVPETTWFNAAFMFDDRDHWARFVNGDMGKAWFQNVEDEAGITVLGDPTKILRGPYRVMVSGPEVNGLDDIDGLKLRMHPNQLAIATWSHLGAEVITLPWTDVYQSIDTGLISAVNSPIALVESMRFNEVASHIARTDEYHQSIGLMVNADALAALDDQQRDALMRAYEDAATLSVELMNQATDDSMARMTKAGITYTELDTAPFVARMAEFYGDLEAKGELPEGFRAAVEAARQ